MTTAQAATRTIESLDLTGKVALVTGGGTGIGRASAALLAEHGARVLVSGRREDPLAELSYSNPDRIDYIQADVSKAGDRAKLVEAVIERFGRLETVVNNAGTGVMVPFADLTDDDIEYMARVNLVAPAALARTAAVHLSSSGGSIINISSTAGRAVMPGTHVYAATKAGINQLTRSLAAELGPVGIRVNAVAPGATRTEMAEGFLQQEGMESMIVSTTPLRRIAEPVDVAPAVLYLASDEASWITGQILDASGGFML